MGGVDAPKTKRGTKFRYSHSQILSSTSCLSQKIICTEITEGPGNSLRHALITGRLVIA